MRPKAPVETTEVLIRVEAMSSEAKRNQNREMIKTHTWRNFKTLHLVVRNEDRSRVRISPESQTQCLVLHRCEERKVRTPATSLHCPFREIGDQILERKLPRDVAFINAKLVCNIRDKNRMFNRFRMCLYCIYVLPKHSLLNLQMHCDVRSFMENSSSTSQAANT